MADPVEVNRARWDELARTHGQDSYYDVEAFLAGADTLQPAELAELPDVAGLELLHLQCHFGLDTLSWARRGARVTGVDFSSVAVERARGLAERTGLPARFAPADVLDLPADLGGRFDVVVATYGVLCWISDIGAWMRSAASALRPGGRLVVVDLHPLLQMFDSVDPLVLDFPYADVGALYYDSPGSYADPGARMTASASVNYAHSLGETVTAAADAGLRVDTLREHLSGTARDERPGVTELGEDGRYRFRLGGQDLPVLFTLAATRPGA